MLPAADLLLSLRRKAIRSDSGREYHDGIAEWFKARVCKTRNPGSIPGSVS